MPDWPEAILFDFDGVIVHSEPLHLLAFQRAAAELGMDLSDELYYSELLGNDDRGTFKRLIEIHKRPHDPAILLQLCARKREIAQEMIHQKHYNALPGVEQLVRGLWRNYPLAICSGALAEEIELMLEGISLRDCFRVIVSAEDVTVGKPDPESYLRGIELLAQRYHRRINPKNCLVFEDAPRVIDRLKPLGFTTVGVTATMPAERFTAADHLVKSLEPEEVLKQIPRLQFFTEPHADDLIR